MPVQNLNLHCHFKFADGRALSGADGTEATSIMASHHCKARADTDPWP